MARALNITMKNLFTSEVTPKSTRSEANQTLSGLRQTKLGDRGNGRPLLAWSSWPGQSGRSFVPGRNESNLMKSQLG